MAILVVDVEATCWPDDQPELRNRQRELSEIIEIGAVRLRGPELVVDGEFQTFVRPLQHPELSPFCVELTSISQAAVDAAEPFPQAWSRFYDWFAPDLEGLVMASWSVYDHVLFERQLHEHGLGEPPWENIDIKAEFAKLSFLRSGDRLRPSLAKALTRAGVPQSGRAHRAIVDARNTAALLQRLRAPSSLSLLARHVLRCIQERGGAPTHAGHLRAVLPNPKRWYHRVRKELVLLQICEELPNGRGMRLTPHGRAVVEALKGEELPEAVEPV